MAVLQNVIIDMRAMLNNAIKGDYNAETDPSVSTVITETYLHCKLYLQQYI